MVPEGPTGAITYIWTCFFLTGRNALFFKLMYCWYLLDTHVDILPKIQKDPKKLCAFYKIALSYPEAEINNSKVRVKLGGKVNI